MKTSKILKKTGNGTWNTKQGETMYAWELEMENGDTGTANTKDADGKNLPEGETIDYNITPSDKGNKIQKVYVPGQGSPHAGSNGSTQGNDSYYRCNAMNNAVEWCKASGDSTKVKDMFDAFLKILENK